MFPKSWDLSELHGITTQKVVFFTINLGSSIRDNYWVSGLYPSSGILNTRTTFRETGSIFVLRRGEGDTYRSSFCNAVF
jgi:hypothetical protein